MNSLLRGFDALSKALDESLKETKERLEKEWVSSIMKWRGISFDDFLDYKNKSGVLYIFDVGPEVYFMQDNSIQSGVIDKIEISILEKKCNVWYCVASAKERLEPSSVFASKDELKEALKIGMHNGALIIGDEYNKSDYTTPAEIIEKSGYSKKEFDILTINSKWWIMDENKCVHRPLSHILIEIVKEKVSIEYGLELEGRGMHCVSETKYFTREQLFAQKEDLINSL